MDRQSGLPIKNGTNYSSSLNLTSICKGDIYPDAEKIIVILGNLNTHNFSAFYETFDADEAA